MGAQGLWCLVEPKQQGRKTVRDAKEAVRGNGDKIKEIKPDRTLGRKDPRWAEEFGSWQSSLKTFPLMIK